jgi:chromosome segregation ATPase
MTKQDLFTTAQTDLDPKAKVGVRDYFPIERITAFSFSHCKPDQSHRIAASRRRAKELSVDHSNHTTLLQNGGQSAIADRMRDLLARASQDHVYEQRTQGAVLDEIRQRLEGMEWLLREVRERELGGLSGTLEAVSSRIDAFSTMPPQWAEGLAQHVEVVRDHIDSVGERVGTVDARVESVNQRVTPVLELPNIWADLTTVGESVEEALNRLQSVLDGADGISTRLSEFAGKLGQLNASMEAAGSRFTRLDKSISELTARAEHVEGGVVDLAQGLALATGEIKNAVEQVNAKVEESEQRVIGRLDGVDSRVDRVDGRLIAIDSRLNSLDGRIETADECLADIDTRLDGMDGRLHGVDSRLGGIDKRLGTVDGQLTGVDKHMGTMDGQLAGLDRRLGTVDGHLAAFDKRLVALDGQLTGVDGHLDRHDDRFDALGGRIDSRFTTLDERLSVTGQHLAEAATRNEGRFNTLDTTLESIDDRLGETEEQLGGRFDAVDAHLGGLVVRAERAGEHLEAVDDRVEAVNQRVGQLPVTLGIGERVGELLDSQSTEQTKRFDSLEERLTAAAAELAETIQTRPDQEELTRTVTEVVTPASADLTKRLSALEETMLALAEALLRPTRAKD